MCWQLHSGFLHPLEVSSIDSCRVMHNSPGSVNQLQYFSNQCLGRLLGISGWDPKVSKSDWLCVDIVRCFFIKLKGIFSKWWVFFRGSWTSTGSLSQTQPVHLSLGTRISPHLSVSLHHLLANAHMKMRLLQLIDRSSERTNKLHWIGTLSCAQYIYLVRCAVNDNHQAIKIPFATFLNSSGVSTLDYRVHHYNLWAPWFPFEPQSLQAAYLSDSNSQPA